MIPGIFFKITWEGNGVDRHKDKARLATSWWWSWVMGPWGFFALFFLLLDVFEFVKGRGHFTTVMRFMKVTSLGARYPEVTQKSQVPHIGLGMPGHLHHSVAGRWFWLEQSEGCWSQSCTSTCRCFACSWPGYKEAQEDVTRTRLLRPA